MNAGTDQEITEGDTVTLAGTATDADPEDDPEDDLTPSFTHVWSHGTTQVSDRSLFISLDRDSGTATLTPSVLLSPTSLRGNCSRVHPDSI